MSNCTASPRLLKNITLIDKKNVHNNRLQIINQYAIGKAEGASYDNRYDVTILVDGLPLVYVEVKRRGVAIWEAFNQIDRFQQDSFWAGSGLYEHVQIFVISNGTNTKYYFDLKSKFERLQSAYDREVRKNSSLSARIHEVCAKRDGLKGQVRDYERVRRAIGPKQADRILEAAHQQKQAEKEQRRGVRQKARVSAR